MPTRRCTPPSAPARTPSASSPAATRATRPLSLPRALRRITRRREARDAAEEVVLHERFDDVVVGAELLAARHVLVPVEAADDDDRKFLGALLGTELLQQREAVDVRQHHVEQHEIGQRIGRERLERGGPGHGRAHRVSLALEPALRQVDQVGVVVDDQDVHRITSSARTRKAGAIVMPRPLAVFRLITKIEPRWLLETMRIRMTGYSIT